MTQYKGNTSVRGIRCFEDLWGKADKAFENHLYDEAIIDGRVKVRGRYKQTEPLKVNLGAARSGVKITSYHFTFRLCLCPGVACGMSLEVKGKKFQIQNIDPLYERRVKLTLSYCGECAGNE